MEPKEQQFRNRLNSLQLKILLGFVFWYINNLWGLNILFIPLGIYFGVILFFTTKIRLELRTYPYKNAKQLSSSLIIVSFVLIVFSVTLFIQNHFGIA